eukprot:PITA_26682
MKEEMDSLAHNQTWNLVRLPAGKTTLQNKWVYKLKEEDGGRKRYKARLVVKVFAHKKGIDFDEIFSPVVKMISIITILSLIAVEDLHLEQLDVKTTFLHGDLEEEIYMQQPQGYEGYVDTDMAGDRDNRRSKIRSMFTIGGTTASWVSKLKSVVALSTTEAEYVVSTEASKEMIWLQRFLDELGKKQELGRLYSDSQSAIHLAKELCISFQD